MGLGLDLRVGGGIEHLTVLISPPFLALYLCVFRSKQKIHTVVDYSNQPNLPANSLKIGAEVLNQGEGAFNSGQEQAGPTEATLTTVPSIRNEMANENSETSAVSTSCGGHVSWTGCSGCPDRAPNKPSRCLFNSLPYNMFSKGDVFKVKTVIN